jgi:hypothetical protein
MSSEDINREVKAADVIGQVRLQPSQDPFHVPLDVRLNDEA